MPIFIEHLIELETILSVILIHHNNPVNIIKSILFLEEGIIAWRLSH